MHNKDSVLAWLHVVGFENQLFPKMPYEVSMYYQRKGLHIFVSHKTQWPCYKVVAYKMENPLGDQKFRNTISDFTSDDAEYVVETVTEVLQKHAK